MKPGILVLAIDPGQCTGYAIAAKDDEDFNICYGQQYWSPRGFWHFLDQTLSSSIECYVVCESFEFRQGKQLGVDLYPCELIGVLKLHRTFHMDMTDQLYFQPASVQGKKAYFSDAKLKDMKLYQKGAEHGRSAVKHLLQWFYFGAGYRFLTTDQEPQFVEESWFRTRYLEGGD